MDVHLTVDGKPRTETVYGTDGEPFHTTSSTGARSFRFVDGAWQAEDESGGNGPKTSEPPPPAPIGAWDLLDTPTIAGLLRQGVTPEATGPVTSPGLAGALLTETRCDWVGTNSSGGGASGSVEALDSVELVLAQFNDEDRASAELKAEAPMFPGTSPTTLPQADEAFAGAGTVLARVGSLMVSVHVLYDPDESPRLADQLMGEVLERL